MPGKKDANLRKPKNIKQCPICLGFYGKPGRDKHGAGKCKPSPSALEFKKMWNLKQKAKKRHKPAKPLKTEYCASLVNDDTNTEPLLRFNPVTGTMDPTWVVSGGRPGSNRRK